MKPVLSIAQKLAAIGHRVYIVGSYNVHTLLHKNFGSDIDLTTAATPDEIRSVLRVVGEIGARYGTLIVREWGESYEITTFRRDSGSSDARHPDSVAFSDSIEEDALRRDFTFNAIYFDPLTGKYTDPTGGIEDLRAWRIRWIGDAEARIDEDALRILRFVRLRQAYDLRDADTSYEALLTKRMPDLSRISRERIKQELDKILMSKHNIAALETLKRLGFFAHHLPHINQLSHAPGGKKMHQEWDVWKHTLLSLAHLNHMKCHDLDVSWTTLLHDIGKYETYSYDANGDIHYFGHELTGLRLFEDFVKKSLPFTTASAKKIAWLIRHHIRVGRAEYMHRAKMYRFMMHPYFESLLALYEADNVGKIPPDTECGPRLRAIYEDFQEKLKTVRFVTGADIMAKYPHLQWAEIGRAIRAENDRILEAL